MSTQVLPNVAERVLEPGEAHAHIENPSNPGTALCLIPLKGTRRAGGDCPICVELAHENRTWIAR